MMSGEPEERLMRANGQRRVSCVPDKRVRADLIDCFSFRFAWTPSSHPTERPSIGHMFYTHIYGTYQLVLSTGYVKNVCVCVRYRL